MNTPPSSDTSSCSHPDRVDVAVIIVNYGTADLALQAVDSVLAREHGGRSDRSASGRQRLAR
jgi:hypothetical protein